MKKIISFSLWGDNPKYTIGAIENAKLIEKIYPGWVGRFYCGKSVPHEIVSSLESFENVEVIKMDVDGNWNGMFWRFLACEDSDIMISRDTDSRISIREFSAVNEWLLSDKDFHIMRDHPWHGTQILGGMWGCRNGILKNIRDLIKNQNGDFWQVDQNFLRELVYPKVINNSFVHDSYFNYESFSVKFPTERIDNDFVGDVFDENNNRHPEYFKIIYEQN
jgi:hypothetical protein